MGTPAVQHGIRDEDRPHQAEGDQEGLGGEVAAGAALQAGVTVEILPRQRAAEQGWEPRGEGAVSGSCLVSGQDWEGT